MDVKPGSMGLYVTGEGAGLKTGKVGPFVIAAVGMLVKPDVAGLSVLGEEAGPKADDSGAVGFTEKISLGVSVGCVVGTLRSVGIEEGDGDTKK